MKIVHILSSDKFSGAENVVCQIILMFANSNIDFVYVSLDGEIRTALDERNIRFHPVSKMSVSELKKVIVQEKPDMIHAHDMRASLITSFTCGKIPFISHIHNNAFNSRKISLKSLAYYYAAKKAEHIFWVSKSAYEGYVFRNKLDKKSSVLYNVVDIDALYLKMKSDTSKYHYDVVFLGRLSYPKNPQRLMRVFRIVAEKDPTIKFAVIGTGELEDDTKKLVKEYNLEDRISFLGFQKNPLKILHDSKVMVMTSRWEGTPMCALEAMSLGVPIVSTPTDGLLDIVEHGTTGFLSDVDEELADYIVFLVQNGEAQKKLSQNTKEASTRLNDKSAYMAKICHALHLDS